VPGRCRPAHREQCRRQEERIDELFHDLERNRRTANAFVEGEEIDVHIEGQAERHEAERGCRQIETEARGRAVCQLASVLRKYRIVSSDRSGLNTIFERDSVIRYIG
jgi:hypothetical protein